MLRALIIFVTLVGAAYAAEVKKPEGSVPFFSAHAIGFQVYGCEANGVWSKAEPVAALVSGKGQIVRHYRDSSPVAPAWEASDGSKIHALLAADGAPDQSVESRTPASVPQLGLRVAATGSKGILSEVTYVIRSGTQGGMHPGGACKLAAGTRLSLRYEADYTFFGADSSKPPATPKR